MDTTGLIIGLVALLLILLIVILPIGISVSRHKRSKKIKKQFGAQEVSTMKHVYGLDVPEDAPCAVCICSDRFVFVRNQTDFSLPFSKVTDISIKTNTEIQKNYVSSAGGAAAGAILFGPLGALIGGRTKKKVDVSKTRYLIFAYQNSEDTNFICFLLHKKSFGKRCIHALKNQPHFQEAKSVEL